MREIDDRYPEFAEPYEPVKRVKHKKGLNWPFLAVAGAFLLSVFVLNSSEGSPAGPAPAPKTAAVTISVRSQEEVYTGEEYAVVPQFSYIANEDGSNITETVSVELKPDTVLKATDAGTYPFGLSETSFDITAEGYDGFTVVVFDGTLTIDPAEITAAITGNTLEATYDRQSHSVQGYEVEASDPNYKPSDIAFSGTNIAERTDAGTTYMELAPEQFTNLNKNYDVTFEVTDGYVQIDRAGVNVSITGSTGSVAYDGNAHSVSSYYTEIDNSNYTEDSISFSGSATATRTEVGTTPMGLSSAQFSNTDSNFSVQFSVTDGFIQITEPPHNPPDLSIIDIEDNYNLDMVMFAAVSFKFMPNELAKPGGKLKARIFYDDGSGSFVPDNEYDCSYTGDGNNTEQELTVVHRMPEDMYLVRQKGKLVINYTYPDGTTGKYKSKEFYMYKGSCVYLNDEYGDWGTLINGNLLEVDLIFEENVEFQNGGSMTVSPENLQILETEGFVNVWDGESGEFVEDLSHSKEAPDEISYYRDTDGVLHMHLVYDFGEPLIPAGNYDYQGRFWGAFKDTASGWDMPTW